MKQGKQPSPWAGGRKCDAGKRKSESEPRQQWKLQHTPRRSPRTPPCCSEPRSPQQRQPPVSIFPAKVFHLSIKAPSEYGNRLGKGGSQEGTGGEECCEVSLPGVFALAKLQLFRQGVRVHSGHTFPTLAARHSPPDNCVSLASGPHCRDLPVVHAEVNQVIVRTVDSGDWAETDLSSSDGESAV